MLIISHFLLEIQCRFNKVLKTWNVQDFKSIFKDFELKKLVDSWSYIFLIKLFYFLLVESGLKVHFMKDKQSWIFSEYET